MFGSTILSMGNQVFFNHDHQWTEIVMEGDQDSTTMNQVIQGVLAIDNQLYETKGEVRALADVSKMGVFDIGARLSAMRAMHLVSFDKVAIVGASAGNRRVVNTISGMAGMKSRFRFFETRQEAEPWLTQ
jgi:hypothetical protein